MKPTIARLLVACALALAGAAQAQTYATTLKDVNLRAGPGTGYPVVAVLPAHVAVNVLACVTGYSWCDVAAGPGRGWVYAGNLSMRWDNRDALVPSVAALVGIGIAAFVLEDYWHDHYVDRWWWPERRRWIRPAPPAPRALARPPYEPRPQPRPPGIGGRPAPSAPLAPHGVPRSDGGAQDRALPGLGGTAPRPAPQRDPRQDRRF